MFLFIYTIKRKFLQIFPQILIFQNFSIWKNVLKIKKLNQVKTTLHEKR